MYVSASGVPVTADARLSQTLERTIAQFKRNDAIRQASPQQVADATGGEHYHVPGGSDFAAYQQQLLNAFREIAASRPLRLIGQ